MLHCSCCKDIKKRTNKGIVYFLEEKEDNNDN